MKYFNLQELTYSASANKYKINNTPPQKVVENLNRLVHNILDPLREAWGEPIIVTSGFRCPALNKKIGGAANSQHVLGEAADIRTVRDTKEDNRRLYEFIKSMNLPVDQCINEHDFDWIHVSYGPRHRRSYFESRK